MDALNTTETLFFLYHLVLQVTIYTGAMDLTVYIVICGRGNRRILDTLIGWEWTSRSRILRAGDCWEWSASVGRGLAEAGERVLDCNWLVGGAVRIA